jgi:hypothetical protein
MSFLDHDLLRLIVSQSKSTLDMGQILDEGKILLVSLSPQFEQASRLIGATLLAQLLSAMYARGETSEDDSRGFAVYCDEYASYATADFATLCTEARKFSLQICLAFQVLDALDDVNQATALQAGTLVVFRVSGNDSKVYARSFDSTPPTQEQTGVEPVRAVPHDTISYLLRHGSPDPAVAKFTQTYLFSLQEYLRKPRPASDPYFTVSYDNFDGRLSLTEGTVRQGYKLLNDSLYQCMTDQNPAIHIVPLALYVLAMSQRDSREYAFSHYIISQSGNFYRMLKGFKEPAKRLGAPSFLNPQEQDYFLKQCPSPKKYRWASEAVIQMIIDLRHCLQALSKDPLLTETGLYKAIYRQRTYMDVEAELSNLIKNQNNYAARVKLLTGEHTMRTSPPPLRVSDEEVNERINYIKLHMLSQGLCKPAHEVEEEVRLRHLKLLQNAQNDPPPPSHTNRRRRPRPPAQD